MSLAVYGIRQCDTCRKALKWLAERGIKHRFHDLRADGLDRAMVTRWLDSEFSDTLINRRSTTWRQLDQSQRDSKDIVGLLVANPTLVKRPVFERDGQVIAVGLGP
ncbi:MAG: Spx/MgsR family RNA polymerase-binding regulatory protein, partial [Xanthomonadales bacterium]|nr:Spx/MgsR family RNA polymerase-binding regulatory protein [Xanthomonadales bacterium]